MIENRLLKSPTPFAARPLSDGQCVDLVELLWEVLLLLLMDDAEAGFANQAAHYVQIATHTAVLLIRDHALVRHVVLDDDETVGPQRLLTAAQEVY